MLDFPDSSVGKESTCNAGDPGSIPGLGRSPGEGNLPDPGIDKPILLWAIANTECPNNIAYVSSPRELIGVQLSYYVFWESGVPSFIFPSSVWRALNSVNTGFLFNWNKNLYHTKGSFYLQKQMNNWYFVIMFQMIYFNILL